MTKCNSPTFHKQCSMQGVIRMRNIGHRAVRCAPGYSRGRQGPGLPFALPPQKVQNGATHTLFLPGGCDADSRVHPRAETLAASTALGRAMRPITGTAEIRAPHEVVRRRTTHGLGRPRVSSISPPLDRRWMCRCVTQRGRGVLPSRSRTCELL